MAENINPLAFQIANAGRESQRVQFELQFNLLQNTLIDRFNTQIEDISVTPNSTQRKIDELSKRQEKLVEALPAVQEFRQGMLNTEGALDAVFNEITTLFETYNGDANVDAAEVAAFDAQKEVVAQKIEDLWVFSHPDINNANAVSWLKQDVESIRGLSLSVGTLTSNQAVSDSLTSLQNEVSVAITTTQITAATALELDQNIQADFAEVEVDLFKLTSDEQARREEEIVTAENQLGNLLRAISVSFEINSGLTEALNSRLRPLLPPPGSAVNIIS